MRDNTDSPGRLLLLAVWLAVLAVVLLFMMVLAAALPTISSPGPGGPLDWLWLPSQGRFGILPMCVGSLALPYWLWGWAGLWPWGWPAGCSLKKAPRRAP
nr:hypothetical protein [uncultured Desulfovibrio sp.]